MTWVPVVWWLCITLGRSIWCIWLKFMHSCTAKFETSYFCKGTQHLVLLFPPENTRDARFSGGIHLREMCLGIHLREILARTWTSSTWWVLTSEKFWPSNLESGWTDPTRSGRFRTLLFVSRVRPRTRVHSYKVRCVLRGGNGKFCHQKISKLPPKHWKVPPKHPSSRAKITIFVTH